MKTVAIILNYNDADTTIKHIDRIRSYDSLDAIIVVDNASTDDSVERIKEVVSDKVILLTSKSNHGYGAGNNLGMQYAHDILQAEYALIANPDTSYSEECVADLEKVLDHHPELAVIAPVMTTGDRDEEKEIPGSRAHVLSGPCAWPLRPWLYELMETGPISRRLFTPLLHYPKSYYYGKTCVYVDVVPGSMLMVDLAKMMECGGYDEEVFLYNEEEILASKLKDLGYKTALLLRQSYLHEHSVSVSKTYKYALARQRIRTESSMHYMAYYLGVSDVQLFLSIVFYKVVECEVLCAGLLHIR